MGVVGDLTGCGSLTRRQMYKGMVARVLVPMHTHLGSELCTQEAMCGPLWEHFDPFPQARAGAGARSSVLGPPSRHLGLHGS